MSARALTLAACIAFCPALSGCRLFNAAPNDGEALAAVRGMLGQLGAQLPAGFNLARVVVQQCVRQETPEGHLCDVTLVSTEVPVLGAISLPMRLRLAKREGQWQAFLN